MRAISWIPAILIGLAVLTDVPAQAAWSPDPLVTARTKFALFTTPGVPGRDVRVDTLDGVVTLHGKVSDEKERRRAEELARAVEGVKDVRNLLQVVPPKLREVIDVTDAAIQMRVEKALDEDHALKGVDLKVKSVNNGVVLLAGEVPSMTTYLRALEDVAEVPGVHGIGSEVKSHDLLGEILAAPEEGNKLGGRGLTGAAADLWITTATKLRLLADPQAPGMDVNVDGRDGVVTLFGSAPTREAKEAAGEVARRTKGVEWVENEIQIVPEPLRDAVQARDEELVREVKRALGAREALDGSRIGVEVKGGVARLTGTVPSEEHRLLAVTVAHATPGVRAVEDDLRVNRAAQARM